MANVNGGLANDISFQGAAKAYVNFSGTVKFSGVGVIREIIGYNISYPDVSYTTNSDSSGDWELSIPGGSNDKFRIMAIGEDGENSQIYEHLAG